MASLDFNVDSDTDIFNYLESQDQLKPPAAPKSTAALNLTSNADTATALDLTHDVELPTALDRTGHVAMTATLDFIGDVVSTTYVYLEKTQTFGKEGFWLQRRPGQELVGSYLLYF